MRITLAVLAAATLTVPARATAQDSSSARTFIEAAARRYETHLLANHIDSIVAMYGANGSIMPPNMAAATGPEAIKAAFTGMMAAGAPTRFVINVQNVTQSGDVAFERGTWVYATAAAAGRPAVADSGMYFVHWHKTASGWAMIDHIWNSQNPPMPMPAAPASRTRH